jgi:hypothetical protein
MVTETFPARSGSWAIVRDPRSREASLARISRAADRNSGLLQIVRRDLPACIAVPVSACRHANSKVYVNCQAIPARPGTTLAPPLTRNFERRAAIAHDHHAPTAFAPRLETRTLRPDAFDAACATLMRLVEQDFSPGLLVGVRTGGLVVAEAMARSVLNRVPVLPLTCRRPSTRWKSMVPGLKTILSLAPEPVLNSLRQAEHRLLASRRRQVLPPPVDLAEAAAIGAWLARSEPSGPVIVADDAVDSGATLAVVLKTLREVCPPMTRLRTAVITVTLEHPAVEPDYALYRGVLCRFPWSFDAAG